jgi:effector-binding domain-containing protein
MLDDTSVPAAIEERMLAGMTTVSVAAYVTRAEVSAWWWDALSSTRVYLPVKESSSLDGTRMRWDLPAGRFAVALHAGPHRDVDRTYAALGTFAAELGRDGTGPVREVYLADPLDTPDLTQWRTEVCWPLAPARS